MEGCAESKLSSHGLLETSPELGSEQASTVRNDPERNTMKWNDSSNIQVCQSTCSDVFAYWKKVCGLGQSINDYPDGSISLLRLRKSSNEVHTNFIPFPDRNRNRTKGTRRSLMFCFDTTTDVAFRYELSNFSLHPSPPEPLSKILVHFCATRMDRQRGIMSFLKNHLFQLLHLWYHQTVTKVQDSGIIDGETFVFPTCKVLFDLKYSQIMLLTFFDLVFEYR